MRLITHNIQKILKCIIGKREPLLAEILFNWTKIVGSKLGHQSYPFKISSYREKGAKINALYISIKNPSISLELQYQQDIIMERIAVYMGFRAIHKLHLIPHSGISKPEN